jgi:hypothetical protein
MLETAKPAGVNLRRTALGAQLKTARPFQKKKPMCLLVSNLPPKPPNPVLAVVLAPKPVAAGCVAPNGEAAGAPNADVPVEIEPPVKLAQPLVSCGCQKPNQTNVTTLPQAKKKTCTPVVVAVPNPAGLAPKALAPPPKALVMPPNPVPQRVPYQHHSRTMHGGEPSETRDDLMDLLRLPPAAGCAVWPKPVLGCPNAEVVAPNPVLGVVAAPNPAVVAVCPNALVVPNPPGVAV